MSYESSSVRNSLFVALKQVEQSPDLTAEEVERVRQFAIRLITEFSALKDTKEEEQTAANPDKSRTTAD